MPPPPSFFPKVALRETHPARHHGSPVPVRAEAVRHPQHREMMHETFGFLCAITCLAHVEMMLHMLSRGEGTM